MTAAMAAAPVPAALSARWWAAMGFVWAGALMAGAMVSQSAQLIALRLESDLGASSTTVGFNGAMAALAILCAGGIVPRMLPRLGGIATSFIGLLLGGLATCAFALGPDLPLWFLWRFLLGLGIAFFWTTNEGWVNGLVPEALRGRCVGAYSTSFSAGIVVGPVMLAGVGTAGALPFLAQGGLLLGWAAVTLAAGRLMPPAVAEGGPAAGRLRPLALMAACPLAFVAAWVSGYAEGHVFNLLTLYAARLGLDEATALETMTLFGIGAVLFQIPVGWLADRMDRRRLLLGAALVTAACTVMLPVALPHPLARLALLIVLGGAVLSFYTLGLTVLGSGFTGAALPGANLLFILVYDIGMLVGPPIGGWAMKLWVPHGMLASLAGGLMLWVLLELRPRRRTG